jgi:PAS domain S-box-containing protein
MNPSAKKKTKLKTESEMKEQKKKSSLNKKSIEIFPEINSTFFDNSLDAMMIGSQDGHIFIANPAACRMLGFSEKEICKLGRKGIVEQTPQLVEAVRKSKESGSFFGELIFIKKDGTHFPGEISSSVFTNSDGREFTTLIIRDITERKKNEQALKESEEKFRTLFESMRQGVFYQTSDGNLTDINQEALNMFGLNRDELLGRTSYNDEWKVIDENGALLKAEEHPTMIALLTGKPVKDMTVGIFNPKRNQFTWVIANATPEFRSENDKPNQVFVTLHDITEKKIAEETLHKSEEKFRLLTETSLIGIYIIQDAKMVYVNPSCADAFGYLPEEIIGILSPKDLIHPDDIQAVMKRLQERLEGKTENQSIVYKAIKKDGTIIHIEVYGMSTDYQGRLAVMGSMIDVTERIKAEDKLRTSEAEYRSLFDNSIMGISQAYPDGKFIRINKAYAEMYGYPDTATMMKDMSSSVKLFSNPDDRKKVLDILDKNGYMPPTELELNRRNGEKFWALVSARQVKNDAGKLLFLQAEHIDITEQKLMEEELRKSKELLEKLNQHLVEVRENERHQIALNLHDDLGQKLTAINLDIAWLKSRIGVQSKSVKEKFEEMSSMIKETVESIRETSSLLRPAILFDLGIVAAIKSQLGSFEKQTGIKCHFYFEPEELDLEDRLALILYRILQESLTNIARHSGASASEIELVILKNKIEMIIEDNGKGIAKDKVNSLESMGIAGMKERVKSANGKIVIRGEPGAGTRIKVIIPLIKEKVDD